MHAFPGQAAFMRSTTIRRWSVVHTWTSLICTLFPFLLALTGLPLIFHHELEHLLGEAPELREIAPARRWTCSSWSRPNATAPGEVVQYLGWEQDGSNGVVTIMAATAGTEPIVTYLHARQHARARRWRCRRPTAVS